MFWKKKKQEIKTTKYCEHDWHELEVRTERVMECNRFVVDFYDVKYAYIYCPRCDFNKKLRSKDWVIIKKAQEVKKKYNAGKSEKEDEN